MNDSYKCWFFSIQKKNNFLLLEIIWLPAAVRYLIFTTMCRILISSKVGNLLQQQKRKRDYPAYKTIAECSIKYVPLFLMTRHGLLNEYYTPSRTNVVY